MRADPPPPIDGLVSNDDTVVSGSGQFAAPRRTTMRELCRAERRSPLLYASLKAVHLLAVIAWLGGMFFMLMCLRPAAQEVLDPPSRIEHRRREQFAGFHLYNSAE